MTQEEILEYNRRCAEILKEMKYIKAYPNSDYNKRPNLRHIWKVDTSEIKLPMSNELNKKINAFETSNGTVLSYQIDLTKLKFHSDWNLIIEVLKHIREIINVKLTIHDFECVRKMKLLLNPYDYDKKQIVQSINKFLTWYKEQTNLYENI